MIMNALRGTLKIAAIKAPYYGEERRSILDDLALSSGRNFCDARKRPKTRRCKINRFGSANFIESNKYSTTIVGGNANFELVEE